MAVSVQQIVETEWALFDAVQNRGGRAPCQDDKQTFFLMRTSQLAAWERQICESYYRDLTQARVEGRNLLAEKYAYMMERTHPSEYEAVKADLPPRTQEKEGLIDRICRTHVDWQQEVAARYPRLAGRGRPLRRQEDSLAATSFETYLWGELSTYSAHTLTLYAEYVARLRREGRNLNEMILQNTAAQRGCRTLEELEAQL